VETHPHRLRLLGAELVSHQPLELRERNRRDVVAELSELCLHHLHLLLLLLIQTGQQRVGLRTLSLFGVVDAHRSVFGREVGIGNAHYVASRYGLDEFRVGIYMFPSSTRVSNQQLIHERKVTLQLPKICGRILVLHLLQLAHERLGPAAPPRPPGGAHATTRREP
jgi:hypothetical protein